MNDIESLIADLEKATGPSREMDVAVTCAIWPDKFTRSVVVGDVQLLDERGNIAGADRAPHYTSSIDAALTLVPAGHMLDHLGDDATGATGALKRIGAAAEISNGGESYWQGQAPTRPLALCIAALKARAAS